VGELTGNKSVPDLEVAYTGVWRKRVDVDDKGGGDLPRHGCHLESWNRLS